MNNRKNEDKISKLVVEYILENITNEKIWIIGSTAACIVANNIYDDKFFMRKRGYESRDIDILCENNMIPRLYKKLTKFGNLEIRENPGEYSLLSKKGILKICKCKLMVGSNDGVGSFLFKRLLNITKIDLYFDIIVVNEGEILDVTKNWAIGDLSRNFCLYKSYCNNSLVIKMLSDVKINKNLLRPTMGNMIEWISSYVHLQGGRKVGYTPTGDKYNVVIYEGREFSRESNLDILRMMNTIKNGETIKMMEIPKLVCWKNEEFREIRFNSFYGDDRKEKILKNLKGNCGVCLNELEDINNYKIITRCNHIFCLRCILNMLKKYLIFRLSILNECIQERENDDDSMYNKCPICRDYLVNLSDDVKDKIENVYLRCKDIKLNKNSVEFFDI